MRAALDGGNLDCLDVLLSLGSEWYAVAFSVASLEARFVALEHLVERGFGWCSGLPGTLVSRLPSPKECNLDLSSWSSVAASHYKLRQSAQRGQNAGTCGVHVRVRGRVRERAHCNAVEHG